MKDNLLVKLAVASAVLGGLTACGGGTDKGYDSEFRSKDQITFETDAINVSLDEQSGVQMIDLLEGAVAGGKPLSEHTGRINVSQMEFVAEDNFVTPQGPSNTIPSHTISPFTQSEDTRYLVVDTEAFAEALRKCDMTDLRGGTDDDGNAAPDGNADFPSQAVYAITYSINNGVSLPAGEALPQRTLNLVMNAIDDPVTSVNIAPLELPAGGQATIVAETVPSYACNAELTYSSADVAIATVDADGLVTGTGTGMTAVTATSVDNPEASAAGEVTVTTAFSLAIANDDLDDLGVPTGTKEIPACVAAGIDVQPFALNHELTGMYGYDWTLTDEVDFAAGLQAANGFGEYLALHTPAQIGAVNSLQVSLVSGDTGATPISEVAPKTVDVTVVNNQMCDPGVSEHPSGFNIDFDLDFVGAAYKGNGTYAASTEKVSDSAASVQITAGTGLADDGVTPLVNASQQVWNKQRNWYSATYGLGAASVASTYRYSVWVKLEQVPVETVTLRHLVVAWNYEGIPPDASGFPGRYGEAGSFTAELEPTTEWQYVEFVNDRTGEKEWSIPPSWNVVTDVFTIWEVTGMPQGDSILLDDYAVVTIEN
ncbi:Ig-like domain-containing protein [Echinimonas agarilytica]|uniref:Ig-like domain-containing protein n=1 Tax=Echinimonas agarilytica TaxID=1215918 RepID=A0AA41W478_9GAMM|nr:Ig-like domain-containing protein [Echinimonas agarilytica]MCM2678525.1 Ig-like domain-containing protein [Echinimonas agarilytica]